jgi:2-oxoglutarate dehydrogenase E1 component
MPVESNLSPQWLDEQYRLWQRAPEQLSADWQAFFAGYDLGCAAPAPGIDATFALKQSGVQSLIYRYRDIGHLLACTDPLTPCPATHPLLELAAFGLDPSDLGTVFHTRRFQPQGATLGEIITILRESYCRHLGVEFMHIQDPAERQWLIERLEGVVPRPQLDAQRRRAILVQLLSAARFEAFLHKRYLGQKRFSLEGGEVLIPVLEGALFAGAALGVREVVFGMPHRGRLNVLANVLGKPLAVIFAEFEDNLLYNFVGEGDVKYHKGFSADRDLEGGVRLHLTLAANPSHLEAVDAVVEGKARARQDLLGASGEAQVLPLLIHGDAAFAGQGMVAEVLNLSQLSGYRTGGTLHVVVNNQIGFTTGSEDARSTRYATDVAKMLAVPIFHVHGEDPEAAVRAVELALAYRQTFAKDVVLEVVCFRRHGHNEVDEPYFTQPLMYDRIKERPSVADLYAEQLVAAGVLSAAEVEELDAEVQACFSAAADGGSKNDTDSGFAAAWQGVRRDWAPLAVTTGVALEQLRDYGVRLTQLPADFTAHPKVVKILEKRRESIDSGAGIDWGHAESLAFATLVAEGHPVRLSGQDVRRGTFGHRHAALVDVETGASHIPLTQLAAAGGDFQVCNSLLSEAAVLGFEYGYSLERPHGLVLWEAQFGDFANGAQVIIDQFIAASVSKWDRASGVTLLLPHGYEGQGAEHSSARIERFLQLCAEMNLQVVNPSTPAQYFHLLRRQLKQPFRRPLVVFTPKSLLRLPACRSTLAELASGGFVEIIPPDRPAPQTRTLMLCSGKIYYELAERREADGRKDIAICRIEQLYPLRVDQLAMLLAPYAEAQCLWVQEEPQNGGPWQYLKPHLQEVLGREPRYVGRYPSAAPAVASHRLHMQEQQAILDYAFGRISAAGH